MRAIFKQLEGLLCAFSMVPITCQLTVRVSAPADIGCIAMLAYALYYGVLWAYPHFRRLLGHEPPSNRQTAEHPKQRAFARGMKRLVFFCGIVLCTITLWEFLSNYYGQTPLFPFDSENCSKWKMHVFLEALEFYLWFWFFAALVANRVIFQDAFLLDAFLWGVVKTRREQCVSHGQLGGADVHVSLYAIWWVLRVLALLTQEEPCVVVEAGTGGSSKRDVTDGMSKRTAAAVEPAQRGTAEDEFQV